MFRRDDRLSYAFPFSPIDLFGHPQHDLKATVSEMEMEAGRGGEYDVFLSFRGPDTRLAFTDFLYTYLDDAGVRTFRDDNELRKGEEIGVGLVRAITESAISIPIFSKNYASSKWCLRELARMVKCMKFGGQLILPIFYDVEPSEVRHQSGHYEAAFRDHEGRFDDRTVKEWKEALREVGALDGWEVKKEAHGYQGKLIKEMIVPTVLLALKKNYMVVTNNLVGIDHHVDEVMRLLDMDSQEVRIVGIHGMGGIGKTTIAKYVYNKLLEYFECRSFLAEVRETAQRHGGLVSLQKQLLTDTIKWSPNIPVADTGINMIKRRFARKKALIVLDDVDEKSQFDWIVGNCSWFGSGSRIIVTTRDKHVLHELKMNEIYEPPGMNSKQSLQLFSMHAFRRESPPDDYYRLSREIASTTAGLPLGLEVIGSFLSANREKVVWEDTLNKLKKIPDDQVLKKLRISYEALNYEQKQIFLDVACIFIGMDKSTVVYMWDDCGYHPRKEIEVLCLMSLIKIGNDNVLRMHDQLRDLGREIVRQENFNNPGKRSRLWHHEEALEVLEEGRGTDVVEALSFHFVDLGVVNKKPCFSNKEFVKLVNLRYLRIDDTEIVGDFKHLLSRLRWLQWTNCPPHFKPTNFHLKNLVILDLSFSSITENWKGWKQIKMAGKLKVVQLVYCGKLRRTPSFSSCVALEILILRGCYELVEIDPSIGSLKNLKVIDVSMTDISSLPDEIWMLEKLQSVDASNCYNLKGDIPVTIGRLSSLRFLNFFITKIESLPASTEGLSCLQTLNLGRCTKLQSLPELPSSLKSLDVPCTIPNLRNLVDLQRLRFFSLAEIPLDIGKLSRLETLILQSATIGTLPKDVAALSQLKILEVVSCDALQCILELPSSLVELSLLWCKSLERLSDLSTLKNLLELKLIGCYMLTDIQGLEKLESLKTLDISDIGNPPNLDGLKQLVSLTSLRLSAHKKLEETPDLSNLKELKRLNVSHCEKLVRIQGLEKLESLEYLDMSHCTSLQSLPRLSNLKMLAHVELPYCKNLRNIEGLETWETLKALDVSGCSSLDKIPYLPNTDIQGIKDPLAHRVSGGSWCDCLLLKSFFFRCFS